MKINFKKGLLAGGIIATSMTMMAIPASAQFAYSPNMRFNQEFKERGPRGDILADFLGVDSTELRDAKEAGTTIEDLLSKYGKTQDEFDQFKEDNRPEFREGGQRMKRGNPEDFANFLGISVDKLQAQKDEGTKLEELLAENGKTEAEFEEYKVEQRFTHMQEKIDSGEVTQEEQVNHIQQMIESLQALLARFT